MKYITRLCFDMHEAEEYLNELCNKYDHAKLVAFPINQEEGVYTFQVK